jgi:hypothetical protein
MGEATGPPAETPFNPGSVWTWQIPFFSEEIANDQSIYKGASADPTKCVKGDGSRLWVDTDVNGNFTEWSAGDTRPTTESRILKTNTSIRIWN